MEKCRFLVGYQCEPAIRLQLMRRMQEEEGVSLMGLKFCGAVLRVELMNLPMTMKRRENVITKRARGNFQTPKT